MKDKRTYVLIAGSRYLSETFHNGKICALLKEVMRLVGPKLTIINGDCKKGVDSIVKFYCNELNIDTILYPANWDKYGKSAGYVRNNLMIDHGKPDYTICIYQYLNDKSSGTFSTETISKKQGIPTFVCDTFMLMDDYKDTIHLMERDFPPYIWGLNKT